MNIDASDILASFIKSIVVGKITTIIDDHKAINVVKYITATGHIQPDKEEDLIISQEEQRSIKTYKLYCPKKVMLNVSDIVVYKDKKYRVLGKNDWSNQGFISYKLMEDYE